nr:hypothetical protein Iba_chr15bCG11450 [Ipomoea batatas]
MPGQSWAIQRTTPRVLKRNLAFLLHSSGRTPLQKPPTKISSFHLCTTSLQQTSRYC